MVGVVSFLPIFLIGLTSAQCPTECNPCKVFNDGQKCGPTGKQFDCGGTWNLMDPNPNPRCNQTIDGDVVNVCLYRRKGDGKEFCFCDPGNLEYEPCTSTVELERCRTQCYNATGVNVVWNILPHNDAASCNKFCLGSNSANNFFLLSGLSGLYGSGTYCGCSLTDPALDRVDSSYCDVPCTGRKNTQCGRREVDPYTATTIALFVNVGPIIAKPVNRTDGACYNNTKPIYPPKTFLPSNDKDECIAYCKIPPSSFTHIGLGSSFRNEGYECYCGSGEPKSEPVAPYYCCGSPCPGNNDEECGYYQNWDSESFINVWKI